MEGDLAAIERATGGKYRLLRRIGQGGMGEVYEGEDTLYGRRVALKFLLGINDLEVDAQREMLARFQREARVSARIRSDNVVTVYDAGRAGDHPFIAMEMLAGQDLARAMQHYGTLPVPTVLKIGRAAALGLQAAHEAGVVHRDIKPANLFLTNGAEPGTWGVKILDFGVAGLLRTENVDLTHGLTKSGTLIGSPTFMAPEQIRGRDLDARADVWSLCTVLYCLLVGRPPHVMRNGEGGGRTLGDLLVSICSHEPPPVTDVAPWVPRLVSEAIGRGLRLDPNERYESAAALAEAMQELLGATSQVLLDADLRTSTIEEQRAAESWAPGSRRRAVPEAPELAFAAKPSRREKVADAPLELAPRAEPAVNLAAHVPESHRPKWLLPVGLCLGLASTVGALSLGLSRVRASSAETAAADDTSAAASASAPAEHRESGRIAADIGVPDGAIVHVDGRLVPTKAGRVKVEGNVGTKKDVVVEKGGQRAEANVELTVFGPSPKQIDFGAAPSSRKERP